MDLLLSNGDHALNQRGLPIQIDGNSELVQQAIIRLTVPKGSFELSPDLGSSFSTLLSIPNNRRQEMALQLAKEALVTLQGIRVDSVVYSYLSLDSIKLEICLTVDNQSFYTNLYVSG